MFFLLQDADTHILQNALKLLETRRRKARPKNASGLDGILSDAAPTFRRMPSLIGMRQWLQLLGHSV